MKKIKQWLQDNKLFIFASIMLFLLKLPSTFNQHWTVDESMHVSIGKGVIDGKVPYLEIWDHKPPFLSFFTILVDPLDTFSELFALRLFTIISAITCLYFIIKILRIFVTNKYANLVITLAVSLFVFLIGTPFWASNHYNGEIIFITTSTFALYHQIKHGFDKPWVSAGLLFFTSLIKQHAFLEAGVIMAASMFVVYRNKQSLKNVARFLVIFVLMQLVYHSIFAIFGLLPLYLSSVWLDGVKYTEKISANVQILNYGINLKFLIVGFTGILGASNLLLYILKKIDDKIFLLMNYTLISLFMVLIPTRFYIHYLIAIVPPIVLWVGVLGNELPNYKKFLIEATIIGAIFVISLVGFFARFQVLGLIPVSYTTNFYLRFARNQVPTMYNKERYEDPTIDRYLDLADKIDNDYSEIDSYYIHTDYQWVTLEIPQENTNTFPYTTFIAFDEASTKTANEDLAESDLVIVDTLTKEGNIELLDLSDFREAERYEDFVIYVKK